MTYRDPAHAVLLAAGGYVGGPRPVVLHHDDFPLVPLRKRPVCTSCGLRYQHCPCPASVRIEQGRPADG